MDAAVSIDQKGQQLHLPRGFSLTKMHRLILQQPVASSRGLLCCKKIDPFPVFRRKGGSEIGVIIGGIVRSCYHQSFGGLSPGQAGTDHLVHGVGEISIALRKCHIDGGSGFIQSRGDL